MLCFEFAVDQLIVTDIRVGKSVLQSGDKAQHFGLRQQQLGLS